MNSEFQITVYTSQGLSFYKIKPLFGIIYLQYMRNSHNELLFKSSLRKEMLSADHTVITKFKFTFNYGPCNANILHCGLVLGIVKLL